MSIQHKLPILILLDIGGRLSVRAIKKKRIPIGRDKQETCKQIRNVSC